MPSTPVSVLSQVSPRTGLLICMCVCVCRIRILQAATASVAAAAWAHKWHLAGKHSVRHHPHPHHHHGHPSAAIEPQHLHLHRCQAHCWRANAHSCYYNSFYVDATYQLTITSLCIMNPEYKQVTCGINLCPVDSFISFTLSALNSVFFALLCQLQCNLYKCCLLLSRKQK